MRNFFSSVCLAAFLFCMVYAPCMMVGNNIDSLKRELLKTLPDTHRVATLQRLYDVYMLLDNRKEAVSYLNQAFALAVKIKDKKQLAFSYFNLGSYNNTINDYVSALANSMEALRLYRELRDKKGEAATLMNIGITYFTIKEFRDALKYYHQAELLFIKNNEPEKADIIKYLIAYIYLETELPFAALKIFKEIVESGKNLSNQRRNECLVGIGTAYLRTNMLDSAEVYINASYVYFDSIHNENAKCFAGARLSECYLKQGQSKRAIDSGLVNLELALLVGNRDVHLLLFSVLSQAYQQQGDIAKAFSYQKKYYDLKDAFFNETSLRRYSVLERQKAEEQHNHALVILEQQKRNQKVINIAEIGLLVLVIAALIYRFILKQRVNKKLKISNQKLADNNVQLAKINIELNRTLEVLKHTQEKLLQQEKIASLGKVTAGIAHEIQNPLNFVTNFATINNDLLVELKGNVSEDDRKESMALLLQNNEKIRQHGLRANTIVKEMLMETRESALPRDLTDINKLLRENFDFAYQAFKTRNPGFICDTKLYIQSLPKLLVEQQQLGRVFLNLFDNALYASRQRAVAEPGFKPRLIIKTDTHDGNARITIEDNGKGIAPGIIKDIFNPFYTTKPTGEGTGLGLSICYDIITKRHNGMINVESELNQFSRFIIELPIIINEKKK